MSKKVEKMEVLKGENADLKKELAKLHNIGKLRGLTEENTALKEEKEELLAENSALRKEVKESRKGLVKFE